MDNSFLLRNIEDLEEVVLDALAIVERIENMSKTFSIIEKDLKKDDIFHVGNIVFLKETIDLRFSSCVSVLEDELPPPPPEPFGVVSAFCSCLL